MINEADWNAKGLCFSITLSLCQATSRYGASAWLFIDCQSAHNEVKLSRLGTRERRVDNRPPDSRYLLNIVKCGQTATSKPHQRLNRPNCQSWSYLGGSRFDRLAKTTTVRALVGPKWTRVVVFLKESPRGWICFSSWGS